MYCNGNEQSIFNCSRSVFNVVTGTCTSHSYDLGLKCDRKYYFVDISLHVYVASCVPGDIRITGGPSDSAGRVEVCVNGIWGTVCSDFWDNNDASVVCQQKGYSRYGMLC